MTIRWVGTRQRHVNYLTINMTLSKPVKGLTVDRHGLLINNCQSQRCIKTNELVVHCLRHHFVGSIAGQRQSQPGVTQAHQLRLLTLLQPRGTPVKGEEQVNKSS